MAGTSNITAGIKAIKIAKQDANGTDNTIQLQEADILSLNFDDLGIQKFEIVSISEFSDYYLYYVKPHQLGIYRNYFNSPGDSSSGGSGGSGYVNTDGNMLVNAYPQYTGFIRYQSSVYNKSVQTFNAGTGLFTAPAQKQPYTVQVNFTSSIFSDSNNSGNIRFYISSSAGLGIGTPGINIPVPANSSGSANAKTISGSISFIVPSLTTGNWGFRFINYYGSNAFYMPTSSMDFSFNSYVTSSTDTNGVPTVLEPYTTENISNNDYNVIINNAITPRLNDFYMDVDYNSNAIIAVNQQQILSGSATRATVQQSNYTLARQTYPRYIGSKNISPNFNESYGNTDPSVEIDGMFFAYFDWVGGTSYELTNKAGYHIKYLIDSEGNVATPNSSGSYYWNLINSFNANNNNVNVLFKAGETTGNVDNLIGVHPVIRPAAQARTVLFSQTGSGENTIPSMSFSDPSGLVSSQDYTTNTNLAPDAQTSGVTQLLDISSAVFTGTDATVSTTNDYIKITNSGNQVAPRISMTFNYEDIGIQERDAIATITFERSTDGGTSWESTPYNTYQFTLEHLNPLTLNYTAPSQNAVTNLAYRVKFSFSVVGGGNGTCDYSGTFGLSQFPPNVGSITSPYWTTGSLSQNVLTGSKFTSDIYGLTQDIIYTNNDPNSGSAYDKPYLPLQVKKGDQIRFGGNEADIYEVIEVNEPANNSGNDLYLTLNSVPALGTNINSFMIRTFVDNPNFVLVDALKDSNTGGGAGFLLPEYASQTVLDNFDNIIKDLTEKGLI